MNRRGALAAAVASTILVLPAAATGARTASIFLEVVRAPGTAVSEADLAKTDATLRARLKGLGLVGTSVRRIGQRFEIRSPRPLAPDRVAALVQPGVIEFYDLEADLVPPSIRKGFPVASRRRLLARAARVRITCRPRAILCPGVNETPPSTSYYYLFRHDPDLTARDLKRVEMHLGRDSISGLPTVLREFTENGRRRFHALTRVEAARGKRVAARTGNHEQALQHSAVVLDRELLAFPSIDFRAYPDGIDSGNGLVMTTTRSAAAVLASGPLPVRLRRVG